ncbi:MAG TPA: CBS domain-containing protein [Bdellovibrionota bacterium]|nr:CBS domain-containing protein [Bdellovibrionota bacterium]
MRCKDLMNGNVRFCRELDPIHLCAKLMRDHNIGFVPVLDVNDRAVGVVTDRDITCRVVAVQKSFALPVREIMTRHLLSCGAEDELGYAEAKMSQQRKSRILVMNEEGKAVGVISLSDIARAEPHRRSGRVLEEVTRREGSSRPVVVI